MGMQQVAGIWFSCVKVACLEFLKLHQGLFEVYLHVSFFAIVCTSFMACFKGNI